MKKQELQTPAILLDMDILERNIRTYQEACNLGGKSLWPMIKTHKSAELAKMQLDAGAEGFLCGTLDECEMLCRLGAKRIMYAYPTANPANIRRFIALEKQTELIIRLDSYEAAALLQAEAEKEGVTVPYTVIVDMGFHRFGILPGSLAVFVQKLSALKNLKFLGISTHPGQVYGAASRAEVEAAAKLERDTMKTAAAELAAAGFPPEIVSSGSTPTFLSAAEDDTINTLHPGNYTFFDAIQIALGSAMEKDCALRVFATIIAHPSADRFLCDAGSKCLGLDQGAHGSTSIKGYGRIVGHPELTLAGLSEEVGKILVSGTTDLKIGDTIEIIPNHSCSSANNTSFYTAVRGDEVVGAIPVDARENSIHREIG